MHATDERKIVSIILAAGKGARMQSPHLHKVCYQVGGKPVIVRSIEGFGRCGIDSHFVVVGELMEQVIRATSQAPGKLFFAHQKQQSGTGSATRCATDLLQAMGYEGDVLLVPGDKVIEEEALARLVDAYYRTDSDMALMVGDLEDFPSAGRVVSDSEGKVLAIVESFDTARAQLLSILRRLAAEGDVSAAEVEGLALAYLKHEDKAAKALGSLWDHVNAGGPVTREMIESRFAQDDGSITIGGKPYPLQPLLDSAAANLFVYLVKAPLLYEALGKLSTDNAQGEEYLTDIVAMLSGDGRKITSLHVDYPEQVMTFNTPSELQAIEDYLSGRKRVSVSETPKTIRMASEWLRSFEQVDGEARRYLLDVYGSDQALVESKCQMLISMLRSYVSRFNDEPVVITRAPGRVNIMGRHIDRQGGFANLIALDRDLYLVVGARDDGKLALHNMKARDLPGRTVEASDVIADSESDWLKFIDSASLRDRIHRSPGDWSHYVIAPYARFQAAYPQLQLKGMNIVAAGNVPMAAGLSSSSALVVAVAEAIAHINDIDITPEQFVDLCGEGEWYVGTRGGSADHAAMKFAQSGRVIHVSFLPFRMIDNSLFPTDYLFVVCNSQLKAHKTVGAKDVFNHRIACYNIGREVFKLEFPEHAALVEHLRDINARRLGVEYPELLRMLKRIPDHMTRAQVIERLPAGLSKEFLNSHADTFDDYPVRGVVMFGLAECERGRQCAELVRNVRIEEFGQLMAVSHDGDRVVAWDDKGASAPAVADYSDAAMDDLIRRAEVNDPSAQLVMQPGAYGCSVPDIDRMIDITRRDESVLGSQILGAGLGGCILVLIRKDAYPALEQRLTREYYEPMGAQPDMFACRPVAGSRVVFF